MQWYLDAMQKYTQFSGRATRQAYWMFFLLNLLISIGIGFVAGALGALFHSTGFASGINLIYVLATFIPGLAVGVRRIHDTGHTGWWIIVPIVGFIFLLLDTEPQDNQYGPNPKAFTAIS
jgi:uncharacterized membrane protein YhaH (DUF805 family)